MVEANYGKCRYLSVKWEFRKNEAPFFSKNFRAE